MVGSADQRKRTSRHGQPHVHRVQYFDEVEVTAGTPGARRSVEERGGELQVVYRARVQKSRMVPVTETFVRSDVAQAPTGTHGRKNAPENMAPRGKGGAKPAPGGKK